MRIAPEEESPSEGTDGPFGSEAGADADVGVHERKGVGVVLFDGIDDSDDAFPRDDAGVGLNPVFIALVDNHIVVLLVPADDRNLGWDIGKRTGGGIGPFDRQVFPGAEQLLPQVEVLFGEGFVLFPEGDTA